MGSLTTYTAGAWSPSIPNSSVTSIVFDDNYTSLAGTALKGCDCTVNPGRVVTMTATSSMTLDNELRVDTSNVNTLMTFENNAPLIQINSTVQNIGNVVIKRNSSSLYRLDYTLWSSPVTGVQTLKSFLPKAKGVVAGEATIE